MKLAMTVFASFLLCSFALGQSPLEVVNAQAQELAKAHEKAIDVNKPFDQQAPDLQAAVNAAAYALLAQPKSENESERITLAEQNVQNSLSALNEIFQELKSDPVNQAIEKRLLLRTRSWNRDRVREEYLNQLTFVATPKNMIRLWILQQEYAYALPYVNVEARESLQRAHQYAIVFATHTR